MKRSVRGWLLAAVVTALAIGIVALVAFASGSSPGTPSQQLQRWVSSTGMGQDIGALQDDGAHVHQALARHQGATSVRTVCAAMANDAQTFNGQLPSPDPRVTQLLARAYGLEYDAAEACYRAGSSGRALLATSAADRSRARALFGEVLARVAAVTGATVPTTTTTVPGTAGTSFL